MKASPSRTYIFVTEDPVSGDCVPNRFALPFSMQNTPENAKSMFVGTHNWGEGKKEILFMESEEAYLNIRDVKLPPKPLGLTDVWQDIRAQVAKYDNRTLACVWENTTRDPAFGQNQYIEELTNLVMARILYNEILKRRLPMNGWLVNI